MEKENININDSKKSENVESFLKQLINGSILTQQIIKKHLLYILFIVGLSMIYIYNKYQTEDLIIKISNTQKEIKEIRAQSVINESELMILSRESQVKKLLVKRNIELNELDTPPIEIKIENK
ncbi:MAG: hypothetical protein JXR51_06660 [Bacteroidales bacterium]|nr:hypothetical protein [Bacteroidales bacterium]MBN2756844.1 hypothetical protein [Bacteroidales bacterium]